MHGIIAWLIGAIILGVASLVINLVLLVLKIGNLKSALFVRKVVSMLKQLPSETLLACQSQHVSALTFDTSSAQERSIPLYSGALTWHGAPRQTSKVLKGARRQLNIRLSLFALIFIPILIVSLWLTFFVDWKFIGITIAVIFHQFVPFYIWEYPGFSSVLHEV